MEDILDFFYRTKVANKHTDQSVVVFKSPYPEELWETYLLWQQNMRLERTYVEKRHFNSGATPSRKKSPNLSQ